MRHPNTYSTDSIVLESPTIIRHDNRTRDILQLDPAPPEQKPTAASLHSLSPPRSCVVTDRPSPTTLNPPPPSISPSPTADHHTAKPQWRTDSLLETCKSSFKPAYVLLSFRQLRLGCSLRPVVHPLQCRSPCLRSSIDGMEQSENSMSNHRSDANDYHGLVVQRQASTT